MENESVVSTDVTNDTEKFLKTGRVASKTCRI